MLTGVKKRLKEFDVSEVTTCTCSKCTNNIVQGIVTSRETEQKGQEKKIFCSGISDGKTCLLEVSFEPSSRSIIDLYQVHCGLSMDL